MLSLKLRWIIFKIETPHFVWGKEIFYGDDPHFRPIGAPLEFPTPRSTSLIFWGLVFWTRGIGYWQGKKAPTAEGSTPQGE